MVIPTLTTDRLTLRPMQMQDLSAYHCLMQSGRACHMGGPFTTAAALGMFCADHAQWDFFGCGTLMITNRPTGQCLGQVAINSGPLFPAYKLGWLVYPAAEGQGHALEAARTLRDWARAVRKLETLVGYVAPGNGRSIRLAERRGAARDDHAARPDPDALVYRHFGTMAKGRSDR